MQHGIGRRVFGGLALAACVGLGGLGAWASVAAARAPEAAPPQAPVIATVDLEQVIQGMKEREDKEKVLTNKQEEYKNRLKALQEEINNDKTKIENAPEADKINLAKALREKVFRAEFETQYNQKLLSELTGEMLRDLYARINDAVAKLAKQSGYHLVVASDEKAQVIPGDPDTIKRQIALKRVLYADGTLDITQQVVTYLNNQYAIGGGGGTGIPPNKPVTTPPKKP